MMIGRKLNKELLKMKMLNFEVIEGNDDPEDDILGELDVDIDGENLNVIDFELHSQNNFNSNNNCNPIGMISNEKNIQEIENQ